MRRFLALFIMLMLSGVLAFAQNRVVTGTVSDDMGVPIEGASVKLKNSRVGVAADVNGNFRISVPANAVLTISGTGLVTQDVTVGDQTNLTITIVRSGAVELTNVVVTAQGIRRTPKEIGVSTARLTNAEITQAKVTNIATGLAAKVSGLQINLVNNGVNPQTRITLRGNRSILANNQALMVLDDVPVSLGYINSLNPNDIDNVTVLKGASASALYGSDASNGVIIITTKKGTKGKPVIRYSNTTEVETISYMPKFQNRFGPFGGEYNPNTFAGIVYFPEDPFRPYVPYENQNYGPEYNGRPIFIGPPVRFYRADGTFYDSLKTGVYSAKPNAKKDFFDHGTTMQNDFSVSGGDDKSKFFFSLQDVSVTGIVPGDKAHRNTIRLNGTRELGKFSVNYTAGYTFGKTSTTQGSYFQSRPVYWTVINTPANIDLREFRNWRTDPFANPNGYFNAYYGNPWWQIDASRLDERQNDLLGSIALNFKAASWLNFRGTASISRQDYSNKYTREGFKFSDYAALDVYGSGRGTTTLDPQSSDAFSYSNRLTGQFLANIEKTFDVVKAKLTLGTEIVDARSRNIGVSATALVLPDFYNISNKVGEPGASEGFSQTRKAGAYADLTLGYNDYLFVHSSVRNDWTSLLAKDNRSYLYPAVDVSFVLSDAIASLKDNKTLNYAKIRAAYSKTGQVSVGPYSLENLFGVPNTGGANPTNIFPFGNVAGFTLGNNFANPVLKPEFTKEQEVGLELSFFESRINFQAAYYFTTTTNQTIPISISSTTGGTSATLNTGEMTNEGVELDLKLTPIIKTRGGLRWDFGANFSYNKNTLVSIQSGPDALKEVFIGGVAYAITGKPYPTIKVTDWKRDSITSQIIVDKANGYPTLNPLPQEYGTTNPPYKIGLNTSVTWKGLSFSAVGDFRSGAVILNDLGADLDFTGVSWYSAQSGRNRFVIPNSVYLDASGKYVPNTNITTNSGNEGFWASTWNAADAPYVNSADFWKLREVAISYEIPRKLIQRAKWIKGINVGVVGRNLFMWRAKENVWTDPEFNFYAGNGTGLTNINQTPPTRIFGGNLTVNF